MAAELLGRLAEAFGGTIIEMFIIKEITALSRDPQFNVRKAAALALPAFIPELDPFKAEELLIPLVMNLASDPIWSVRKAFHPNPNPGPKSEPMERRSPRSSPSSRKPCPQRPGIANSSTSVRQGSRMSPGQNPNPIPSHVVNPIGPLEVGQEGDLPSLWTLCGHA